MIGNREAFDMLRQKMTIAMIGLAAIFVPSVNDSATAQTASDPTASLYRASNVWTEKVDTSALHPDSPKMIDWLSSNGGFGTGELRVDFSIPLLEADSSTPTQPIVPRSDYILPACDENLNFPLPAGGAIEGSNNYECSESDCHLLVFDRSAGVLYESFTTNVTTEGIQSTCAVKWDLNKSYPTDLRGDQCTSADAAG